MTRKLNGKWIRPFRIAGVLLVLVVATCWILTPKEPRSRGKALSEWLEIGTSQADRKSEASAAIAEMGEAAVPFLRYELKGRMLQSRARLSLAAIAAHLGSRSAMKAVLPKGDVMERAGFGFVALGPLGLAALRDILKTESPEIALNGLRLIGRFGEEAAPATPDLIRLLRSGDEWTRRTSADILRRIPPTPRIVDALIGGLGDPDRQVRLNSALALGRFDWSKIKNVNTLLGLISGCFDGSEAASLGGLIPAVTNAIPGLNKALHDPDSNVGAAAAFALEQIELEFPGLIERIPAHSYPMKRGLRPGKSLPQ